MVIRNLSESYHQPRFHSQPCGEGLLSVQVRLTELTATLNKNSSRNTVGAGGKNLQTQITDFEQIPVPFLEFHSLPVLV